MLGRGKAARQKATGQGGLEPRQWVLHHLGDSPLFVNFPSAHPGWMLGACDSSPWIPSKWTACFLQVSVGVLIR